MVLPVRSTIGVVVVQYYLSDSTLSLRLDAFVRELKKAKHEVTLSVVDIRTGKKKRRPETAGNISSFVSQFLDISAYGQGLKSVPERNVVIVLNDTLFMRHPWKELCRNLIQVLPLLASLPCMAAGGVLHQTTQVLLRDEGNPSRQHLSTFLVALNSAARRYFESLIEALPPNDGDEALNWIDEQKNMHRALGTLLHVHLVDETNPWSWNGLGRRPTMALRTRKAVTVVFEYIFSSEMLRQGGCLIPLNRGLLYRLAAYYLYAKNKVMQGPGRLRTYKICR